MPFTLSIVSFAACAIFLPSASFLSISSALDVLANLAFLEVFHYRQLISMDFQSNTHTDSVK